MPQRLVFLHDIADRVDSPSGSAAPRDFTLSLRQATERLDSPDTPLAYCADLASERVLFTLHIPAGLGDMFGAPFLFPEQLRQAVGVATVPFEQLDRLGLSPEASRPVFVFSLGRTGSTLLTRLLAAAGQACASEPDMLTQVTALGREARRHLPEGMEALLAGTCVASLGRVLGPGAFLKLRSQCNQRPLALVGAAPGCRVVFMLRRASTWAMSRHRAFAEPPAGVAAVLRQAIDALDVLMESGIPLQVVWFEALASDPLATLALCAPGAAVGDIALRDVMESDSQAGTEVARYLVAGRPVQDGFLDAFGAAWAQARQGAEWTAPTLALLERMWAPDDR